nr:hypothetical protein BaRGS_031001 [Batillaria attramentaria]
MAPKKKRKSKGSSSSAKVANKKLNKFAKQGKLRKLRLKQKKKEQKGRHKEKDEVKDKHIVNGHGGGDNDEEEAALEAEDYEYFATDDSAYSFVSSVLKRENKRNRKRPLDDAEDGEEHEFEKRPRSNFATNNGQRMKMLLPIKDEGRVIPQMVHMEEEEEKEEMEQEDEEQDPLNELPENAETVDDEKNAEPVPSVSRVHLFAVRQRKLAERKQKIADLATSVIQNPEENTGKLKELRGMLGEADPDVCLTVRKLVMVSLCEVFKDIIPGYRLRLPTEKEKEQRMKHETKKLMDFEAALLLSYKTYLEYLEIVAKGKPFGNSYRMQRLGFSDVSLPQKSVMDLSEVAVQCLTQMLVSHPHFNYRSNIITFLVPFMNRKNPKISDPVCDAMKQLFRSDKSGEATLEIVRAVSKLVKNLGLEVQPKVLATFLALKIKEVNTEEAKGIKKMKKKEKMQKLSRRERKLMKQKEELDRELQETRATEDRQKRLKVHTEIVQTMFLIYFRILKTESKSDLLPTVLEGLAKFSHLINIDFFHDLFAVFNQLIESGELSPRETLHCVQTAFTILSGQGAALNIDPMRFYTHLYIALQQVHAGSTPEDAALVLDSLDIAITRRRKQVTQQRVLAFTKRLATMCLQQTPEAACGYLALTRCLVSMFPYTDLLFDMEAEGSESKTTS